MKVFHTTGATNQILKHGFKDGRGTYLTDRIWQGVWLSDQPLDVNEGAEGDTVLTLEIPEKVLAKNEWVEEGKP